MPMKNQTQDRLRVLSGLQKNHDGEGAAAANKASVDLAIAFLDAMKCGMPCSATLNDDGFAVLEFEDRSTGFFAEVTFLPDGFVQFYFRINLGDRLGMSCSNLRLGRLDDPEFCGFMESKLGVTAQSSGIPG